MPDLAASSLIPPAPLAAPLLAGLATGARSLGPLAVMIPVDEHPVLEPALVAGAAGEAVADKVAPLPARTEPLPLAGRLVLGALAGGWVARGRGASPLTGALLGAAGAAAGAWVFTRGRKRLVDAGVPDTAVGVAEDAAVVGLARMAAPES